MQNDCWILFITYFVHPIYGISLQIDGEIDLGPKWNGELQVKHEPQKLVESPSVQRTFKYNNTETLTDTVANIQEVNGTKQLTINETSYDFDLSSIFESKETTTKDTKDKMITQSMSFLNDNQVMAVREITQIKDKIKKLHKTKSTKETKTRSKDKTHKEKRKEEKELDQTIDISDHENLNLEDLITIKKKKDKRNKLDSIARDGYLSKQVYRARKVKEDTKVYDFIVHIYKQTLKVFDDIKKKTDNLKLKRKVSALKRSYEDKFSEFLKQTYNHTLKTSLGTQKVILNTINTSNRLLQRLVNRLLYDIDREILRTNLGTVNVFQKEVDREKEIENKHACKKLGVCKLNDDFSDFLVDIMTITLQADDRKVKQAADALTEAFKNADYDGILDHDLKVKMKKNMEEVERWDSFMSRAMFIVLRNILKNKNKPFIIMDNRDNVIAKKTVALHEVMNILNEKLPKSEYGNEFESIKNDITMWKEGRYNNITLIGENVVDLIVEKAFRKLDRETKIKLYEHLSVLMSHI